MADTTAEDIKRLAEQQAKFNAEINRTEDLLESIQNIIGKGLTDGLKDSLKGVRALNTQFAEGADISKQLKTAQKKAAIELEELEFNRNRNLVSIAKTQDAALAKQLLGENRIIDAQIKINQAIDSQVRSLQSATEEEKKITEEKKKQNSVTNLLKNKYKELAGILSAASIFKAIIDGALRFNKISVEIGKNLGYGADNADRVASDIKDIAFFSFNANMTTANLAEAYGQLAEATGYVAEYSEDALQTQVMLTKQFGLTADEAAGIYRLSILTGKSSKAVNDAMVGAFVATRNQLKVGVPFKATIAEAAKVSGRLAANLQNNPESIVKAVVQAKALGSTLEQVASQGEALLNFESSIENELKAELLTGKQLNLERARAAALAGDQITLAQELNKNVGTLEEFQKMNVIQQKALAEAVGLTSDQLADQLRKQKLAQETGKSLVQITKEETLEAEKRQNVQDRFNQAILKVQDLIGSLVAGPLGSFLEILSKALPIITSIAAVYGTIFVISKGIAAFEALKLGYGVASLAAKNSELTKEYALNLLKKQGLATQIGIAAAWAVANPFTALAGLAAAGAVAAGIYALTADDMVDPGYGKRTLLSPEGSIKLNDNDTVIAGTNLGGGGSSIDLTPMISAINDVRAAVDRLYSKDQSINMDGKKVGTTLVQGSYKVA